MTIFPWLQRKLDGWALRRITACLGANPMAAVVTIGDQLLLLPMRVESSHKFLDILRCLADRYKQGETEGADIVMYIEVNESGPRPPKPHLKLVT